MSDKLPAASKRPIARGPSIRRWYLPATMTDGAPRRIHPRGPGVKFAQRVFFWSGIYGIVALLPMYFLEERLGREFPPPTNHPEQYYAFVGVALAWQLAFLLIARDPVRFRPLMVPAIAEKLLAGGAVLGLLWLGRIEATTAVPLLFDLVLGALFIAAYVRTPRRAPEAALAGSSLSDR